jgi:hypothetical protein
MSSFQLAFGAKVSRSRESSIDFQMPRAAVPEMHLSDEITRLSSRRSYFRRISVFTIVW